MLLLLVVVGEEVTIALLVAGLDIHWAATVREPLPIKIDNKNFFICVSLKCVH
jgi:hypothetical protein